MANYMLKPVFQSIFDREFQPNIFDDRLEMQKAIYLLQDMGISVGEYSFLWYKHGPYSQTLQNDILNLQSVENIDIEFSADAKQEISLLKKAIFKENIQYGLCQWLECLGSIQYIKENLLPYSAEDEVILQTLESKKPHLNKRDDNKMALKTLKDLAL